jgi:hypothetical protein
MIQLATHFNMRSLSKNLPLLKDLLYFVKEISDIIAITEETKLTENSVSNISIPGYVFINTNSETFAGGVGLYIANELEFNIRRNLELIADGVESCWIEITRKREKIL